LIYNISVLFLKRRKKNNQIQKDPKHKAGLAIKIDNDIGALQHAKNSCYVHQHVLQVKLLAGFCPGWGRI